MDDHAKSWDLALCNAGDTDRAIWLEPWAEEFSVPSRGELVLRIESDDGFPAAPELDNTCENLVVYAAGGTRIRVVINGVDQESASSLIDCPGAATLTTRSFVEMTFGGFPEARPGGVSAPSGESWVRRLFGVFRIGDRS